MRHPDVVHLSVITCALSTERSGSLAMCSDLPRLVLGHEDLHDRTSPGRAAPPPPLLR
jgi:hypothetical protein